MTNMNHEERKGGKMVEKTVWHETNCARCDDAIETTQVPNAETLCHECGIGDVADEDRDMEYREEWWEI